MLQYSTASLCGIESAQKVHCVWRRGLAFLLPAALTMICPMHRRILLGKSLLGLQNLVTPVVGRSCRMPLASTSNSSGVPSAYRLSKVAVASGNSRTLCCSNQRLHSRIVHCDDMRMFYLYESQQNNASFYMTSTHATLRLRDNSNYSGMRTGLMRA